MMYKLVNGLFPDVMKELCTTNDQIHTHFTRQCNFFFILIMFMQDALEL